MPAAVKDYCQNQSLKSVRDIQNQILSDYKNDFSKHVPQDILPKVNIVWESIPSQLAMGGHLLEVKAKSLSAQIDKTTSFKMILPEDDAFRNAGLSQDLSKDIRAVEVK